MVEKSTKTVGLTALYTANILHMLLVVLFEILVHFDRNGREDGVPGSAVINQ